MALGVGMYDWLCIFPNAGAISMTVQFGGIGNAAGPPARMVGVVAGSAFTEKIKLAARSSGVKGSVNHMSSD